MVSRIDSGSYVADSKLSPDAIKKAIDTIASQHNTTSPELISTAKAAGPLGLPYQIRALNLTVRLEKLQKSDFEYQILPTGKEE